MSEFINTLKPKHGTKFSKRELEEALVLELVRPVDEATKVKNQDPEEKCK